MEKESRVVADSNTVEEHLAKVDIQRVSLTDVEGALEE